MVVLMIEQRSGSYEEADPVPDGRRDVRDDGGGSRTGRHGYSQHGGSRYDVVSLQQMRPHDGQSRQQQPKLPERRLTCVVCDEMMPLIGYFVSEKSPRVCGDFFMKMVMQSM